MKKIKCFVLAAAMLLSLTACGQPKGAGKVVYAMDTVMNLTAYGKDAETALDEAEQALYALDKLLDRHDANSAVSALNRGETVTVSPDSGTVYVSNLLMLGDFLRSLTGGAFDTTLAGVLEAWGFGTEQPRVPSDTELAELLKGCGSAESFQRDGETITLANSVQIDLGGIAKGYAGSLVRNIFLTHDCTGVIDLGGDVMLVGKKADGSDWRIAVKDPNEPSSFLGTLTASGCAVVTSGIYERNFEQDGVTYHHIIDPETGKPAESGLVSATVICTEGAYADALSTAVFIMGAERALAFYHAMQSPEAASLQASPFGDDLSFEMLLVTDDGRVLYTPSLDGKFEPNTESGYTYEKLPPALAK